MIFYKNYMTIAANIYPKVPREGIVKSDEDTIGKFESGISVTIYPEYRINVGGFNEGQERLMHDFRREQPILLLHPLWTLAHLYLENDQMREFTNRQELSTSTAREFRNGQVYIGHSIQPKPDYDDYLRDSKRNFVVGKDGLLFALDKKEYPKEDIPFAEFLDQHRVVAKAILLMDDDQIERLKANLPKYQYDPDAPLIQGVSFADGIDENKKRPRPLIFGGLNGTRGKPEEYFGITSAQRFVHSYPIRIGEHDEMTRNYTPQQALAISKMFHKMKKNPNKGNIAELEKLLFS